MKEIFLRAEKYYRRAIELKPDSHAAHYRYAKLLKKMGRHEEAAAQRGSSAKIAGQPEYRALLQELTAGR